MRSPCLQTGTSPTKPSHGPLFQFSNLFSWCCTHKAQIILALFNGPFNCVKDICIVAQRILRTFQSCETEAPYILNITPPTPIRLSIFRSSATHIHHLYGNEVFYFILYQIFYISLISFCVRISVFLIVAYCRVSFSYWFLCALVCVCLCEFPYPFTCDGHLDCVYLLSTNENTTRNPGIQISCCYTDFNSLKHVYKLGLLIK